MCKMTPLAAVLEELGRFGLSPTVEQGKHLKVRFEVNGQRRTYTVPRSPSDHRSIPNCRAGVRRLLRQAGLEFS